jgi:transcription antitermination factor NusG
MTVKASGSAIINQLDSTEKRWFAVNTKFKCEKYVAQALEKKQIQVYLPLISRIKRYTRKVRSYKVPLINCYIFVHIDKSQYVPVLETEYVFRFLKQGKDLISIPEYEIELLKRVTGDIEDIELLNPEHLMQGDSVEVVSGHLTGLQGKIVEKAGKKSFVVDLETIGYQLRIRIDQSLLRPLNPRLKTA